MYQVRRHNKCLKFMIERDNFIMLWRDKLYHRVQCSLRVAIDARVNKRSGLAVSCRTAVALSQLQVESCIAMLHFFAMVKADSGASNHANLGLLRSPCFQSLSSSRRASVNTFGLFCLTSPHLATICLRHGIFSSTNHLLMALVPSIILEDRSLKCSLFNTPASSPMLIANICDDSSIFNIVLKTG